MGRKKCRNNVRLSCVPRKIIGTVIFENIISRAYTKIKTTSIRYERIFTRNDRESHTLFKNLHIMLYILHLKYIFLRLKIFQFFRKVFVRCFFFFFGNRSLLQRRFFLLFRNLNKRLPGR